LWFRPDSTDGAAVLLKICHETLQILFTYLFKQHKGQKSAYNEHLYTHTIIIVIS